MHPRLEALEIRLAPATQLVVTSEPATVAAGQAFEVQVTAENATGAVDTTFENNISLSPVSNLGGPPTVAATDGVATFSGLTLTTAGAYYLQATSGTLFSMNATAVAVTADAATQLVVTSQPPTTVTAGIGFGLAVAAEDQYGNVDAAFIGTVTVALASNPGGSTLGGTTVVSFSNGLATFAGLTLDAADSGYTLQAASSGLAPRPPAAPSSST